MKIAVRGDFKGRKLSDIWNFSDIEIENNHDYIQLVFPLNKPSRAVFHGFYLKSDSEVSSIRNDQVSKDNLIKSKTWFLGFLKRNDQWRNYSNHKKYGSLISYQYLNHNIYGATARILEKVISLINLN